MQLINSTIYDKDAEKRQQAMTETRRQKFTQAQQVEKAKIQRHLETLNRGQSTSTASVAPTAYKVYIDGLSFIMKNGGSKLLRVRGTISVLRSFHLRSYVP